MLMLEKIHMQVKRLIKRHILPGLEGRKTPATDSTYSAQDPGPDYCTNDGEAPFECELLHLHRNAPPRPLSSEVGATST